MAHPKIVIEIKSGMVYDATADSNVDVLILDRDTKTKEILDVKVDAKYTHSEFDSYEKGNMGE